MNEPEIIDIAIKHGLYNNKTRASQNDIIAFVRCIKREILKALDGVELKLTDVWEFSQNINIKELEGTYTERWNNPSGLVRMEDIKKILEGSGDG